jgi:hypothetical protein
MMAGTRVGVLLVFDRIVDLRPRNPIGRHDDVLARVFFACHGRPDQIGGKLPASSTLGGPSANRKRQRLPPDKAFTVTCFPVEVRGGCAGWTRVLAIIA